MENKNTVRECWGGGVAMDEVTLVVVSEETESIKVRERWREER